MTNRLRINLLALAIVAVGGGSLATRPAEASVFGGCDDLRAKLETFMTNCYNMGGVSVSYIGVCSETDSSFSATCHFDKKDETPVTF